MSKPDGPGAPIRLADPADVTAIRALVEQCFGPYEVRLGVRPLPLEDDYSARVARGEVWVVGRIDGAIVCAAGAAFLLVVTVAVRPELRRRGLGRQLMNFADELARRRGLEELRLYTNERMSESRAFYARLGFEETGRQTIEGRHAVWLSKRVS